jgi:hypothetical protein
MFCKADRQYRHQHKPTGAPQANSSAVDSPVTVCLHGYIMQSHFLRKSLMLDIAFCTAGVTFGMTRISAFSCYCCCRYTPNTLTNILSQEHE